MNFTELPPSKQWATLKYRGERFADVWFKPEGKPFALIFRIPQQSFQNPAMGQQLTAENILKAVAITPAEIESWCLADVSHAGMNGSNPELKNPLPPPAQESAHLDVFVLLKPSQAVARKQSGEPEVPSAEWQGLEARWKGILGLEATLDNLRISSDSLQAEMEASLKKTLTYEEKLHAKRADMADWIKAKNRAHHALPRVREFIHRAVWAMGAPERKQLGELFFKNQTEPPVPFPEIDKVLLQLENLQKDRQVLSAQGVTVFHECKGILASVQEALRTLQANAAANASKKKNASKGGKFFKTVRKWTGGE